MDDAVRTFCFTVIENDEREKNGLRANFLQVFFLFFLFPFRRVIIILPFSFPNTNYLLKLWRPCFVIGSAFFWRGATLG